VRVAEFNNLFEITPLSANETKIRFTTFIDLSGSIPDWIANLVSKDAPKDTLRSFKKMLDKGKWSFEGATAANLAHIPSDQIEPLEQLLAQFN